MKVKTLNINYTVYENASELEQQDKELLEKAIEAMYNAYSPYSQFKVGAAVLLEDGTIVKGNNQENVAYPDGLCAERVAMFAASANYPQEDIKAIAICASSEKFEVKQAVSPCGSCRQVMSEYENKAKDSIRIILGSLHDNVIIFDKVSDLLPLSFVEEKPIEAG